ncbi:MAG: acyl-CoA dehydrogenase [Candidatus Binatia bacterium]|nr:acyl-CoA dehydrogenase [Candidatus Binatia bacterium]
MKLALTDEQELLRDTFSDLFASESSPERVRRAEESGFDEDLWRKLAETGAFGIRVPEAAGGIGLGLLEATILMYEAGRRLATGPLTESTVAARLLADLGESSLLPEVLVGESVVSLSLRPFDVGQDLTVPGGSTAAAIVARHGDDVVLIQRPATVHPVRNLGNPGLARWSGIGASEVDVLGRGRAACDAFGAAAEEWKLLTASYLTGLAREALRIAAAYATERIQFDRPIGAFQAVAHPLADAVTDVEAAHLLAHEAIWAISGGRPEAAALVSMTSAWAALAATRAVRRSLHTHGGYGLSLEYDVQLYFRRAKAVALMDGDPRDELVRVTDRLWRNERVPLPEAGPHPFDFELGEAAESFRTTVRKFFEENLTDELRTHAHFSWDGHHPEFNQKLAAAGLAFPSWPREYGGEERGIYEQMALEEEFYRCGWATHPLGTTRMVGATLMKLGSDELKAEVLPRLARGEAITSLGYTEPGSGSDVAAAQTRAVRDGDSWVINGQKMFTSGANLAQYVLLLTRSDPKAKKHRGLTMFLVPLDTPGIEVQAVHTVSEERTNITYYSDVRVPDRYRIGEVNGGWAVLSYALELEHGGAYPNHHEDLVNAAAQWARTTSRDGRPALEDVRVRERLGLAATHFEASRVLSRRTLWMAAEGRPDQGEGPMAKLFQTEILVQDAQDLLDLAAPESLLAAGEPGAAADGEFENTYRFSPAPTIYAGTSEIMRSIIAQLALGLPRSRS